MEENKNRASFKSKGANHKNHGNKKNFNKNHKPFRTEVRPGDGFADDDRRTTQMKNEGAEAFERKPGSDRNQDNRRNDNHGNKGGRNQNRGGRGKRPQIHDGFDDIRMNPRYVMVDRDESDYEDDIRTEVSGGGDVSPGVTVGRNAVRELLRSGRAVDKIYVKKGSREGSVVVIVAEAISRGIPIVEVDQNKIDKIACGGNHQGVVAMAAGKEYCSIEDILALAAAKGEKPLIVVSDGIEDPHNLGALIRCAECAGAHGIVIPKRRAVGITPVVAKCSAGAIEHMAVARVTNLATALKDLKDAGVWIFAAEAGGAAYYDTDFDVPAAIVFGSEGDGVSHLVKERADFTVSIPMYGLVNSLNVSTAASVVLCHAARVRHNKV